MAMLLGFIGATIFLIGLWQWAQGGASLWQAFRLKRQEKGLSREERQRAEREMRELEKNADRAVSASFRIISVLAVIVWVFFGITMLLELFNINWMGYVASTAKQYWTNPAVTQSQTNTPARQDMLRNMGNNLRR